MYVYVVDSFAQDKKFERDLLHIQARTQDLGINGRFEKITILKNIREIVRDAERKKAETIVAIGNDHTLNNIVTHLTDDSIVIGLIPLGADDNGIARKLKIPIGTDACTVLSKRITKKFDLGSVNGKYFFSSLSIITSENVSIHCNDSFFMHMTDHSRLEIVNFTGWSDVASSQDGYLEAIVNTKEQHGLFAWMRRSVPQRRTVIPITSMTVKCRNESLPVYSEGAVVVKTPAQIRIEPNKLRVIVGT